MQLKKSFTKYLLITAVVLLFINVAIDLIKKPAKKNHEQSRELSTTQIDSVFLSVLDQYGIENEWISTSKIKIADEDSISKQFTVKLPADLSIPLIIKDINKIIENDITGFVSEEKKIFGTTEIRIYTNEILKLKAILIPNAETVRLRNQLSIIISDAYDLSTSDFNSFLSVPYVLSAVMIPGESSVIQADTLKKYSKEYIVLLNNENKETKFRLESGDQKELIKNSVINIVSGFRKAVLFCVDEQSKLFNSTIYNFVRDDFKRHGVKLVHESEFLQIASDEDSELISKFRYHCDDKSNGNQKIFLMSFEDFLKIRPELEKFRKKGNMVVALSSTDLVKKLKSEGTVQPITMPVKKNKK